MGLLADSRSRRKISSDPNNTKWTRDTTTFGQKILRSQGWEPGQYLGAKDASHSELHTAANATYIRVSLKDDMKGLGYGKSKENEVTGLDIFSDLLNRLNGKSQAEVDGYKQARLVIKTNRYVELKWGPMRFLRGGLLVGDTMKVESSPKDVSEEESDSRESAAPSKVPKKKKENALKRKAECLDHSDLEPLDDDARKKIRRKEEKKAKKKLPESASTDVNVVKEVETAIAKKEKAKKSKRDKANVSSRGNVTASDQVSETTRARDEVKEHKMSKKERKEKKEKSDKKDKKATKDKKKRRRKEVSENPDSEMSNAVLQTSSSSALSTGQSTPIRTEASRSIVNRNFVRSRFIAQKRQAFMDTKALNQIFMIKA